MSRTFYIADLHLGHEKVADIRGFDSTAEHDEEVMRPILALRPTDRLWILGDISSGKNEEAEEYALEYLRHSPAELHLIAGNHDSVSSIHRQGYSRQAHWMETFESVQQFARIRMNRLDVLMSHYPYARAGDGPGRSTYRYAEYRLPDEGFPLMHGHTHQTEPHMQYVTDRWTEATATDFQQFCVSWDAHEGLVGEHEVYEWIKAFKGAADV